jgi:hypothetical protein
MIGSALVINGGGNVAAHTHRISNNNQCHHNAATHNQKPDGTPPVTKELFKLRT